MRNFLMGFFCASAIAVVSMAAPFNSTVTRRADLAFVDEVCVKKNTDGGVSFRPMLTVPEERSLPDAGTRLVNTTKGVNPCEIGNATVRTNILNFMGNQALTCGLDSEELSQ